MTLKIYLDTSVFSLAADERSPERRELTLQFFAQSGAFELVTSSVTIREIEDTSVQSRRDAIRAWLAGVEVIPLHEEMILLARKFIDEGAFSEAMEDDALHVAAAAVSGAHILLSWNFKHLVNRRRSAVVQMVLSANGFAPLEILAPPEV